jgi:hypothetical protein
MLSHLPKAANDLCQRLIGAIAVGVPGAWYLLQSSGESRRDSQAGKTDDRVQLSGERQRLPDSKGGFKKRVDSDLRKNLGEDDSASGDDTVCNPFDSSLLPQTHVSQPASSKKPGDFTTTSGKQAGLSNTDTRHSHDIVNDPGKSKKGEGTAETAKLQGTVQAGRPQVRLKP